LLSTRDYLFDGKLPVFRNIFRFRMTTESGIPEFSGRFRFQIQKFEKICKKFLKKSKKNMIKN